MNDLYIGLMSGTSTDGVDAVLADINHQGQTKIITHDFVNMPTQLRQDILALNKSSTDELHKAAIVSNELAILYSTLVAKLLNQNKIKPEQIKAIGAHGQTVRHAPQHSYSIQLNNAPMLAELSGIDVITDFRNSDIAAGGHGAPLVPAFHKNLFTRFNKDNTVILNLGGIANVTVLHNDQAAIGFDTGPANMLLDAWIIKCKNQFYDDNGEWAKSGNLNHNLLDYLIKSEPWFDSKPPKSTGRDLFNLEWLEHRLNGFFKSNDTQYANNDIQATLAHLTVKTVIQAIANNTQLDTQRIIVCGGGALNPFLMQLLLQYALEYWQGCEVISSADTGIDPQHIEALAFAWMAWAYDNRIAANMPDVTGAKGPRILGCKYLAG